MVLPRDPVSGRGLIEALFPEAPVVRPQPRIRSRRNPHKAQPAIRRDTVRRGWRVCVGCLTDCTAQPRKWPPAVVASAVADTVGLDAEMH